MPTDWLRYGLNRMNIRRGAKGVRFSRKGRR